MNHDYQMTVGGLGSTFHLPKATKSAKNDDGSEKEMGLPASAPQPVYRVEDFPGCPDLWMHGSANANSYFVKVEPERGMWLDFNACRNDTHDVAIVVSIQGLNPLTGRKTDVMRLEQYKTSCPVHSVELHEDRLCPKCGFRWPTQNYLTSAGTPWGYLWLDGFRAADGVVRQYVFTEDETKGVAAKKLGKDRVFAIGVAFYRSKKPKPGPQWPSFGGGSVTPAVIQDHLHYQKKMEWPWNEAKPMHLYDPDSHSVTCQMVNSISTCSQPVSYRATSLDSGELSTSAPMRRGILRGAEPASITPVKQLDIRAGARIRQQVYVDPNDLSHYEDTPIGMIYINYADPETFKRIMDVGERVEASEGFLSDVEVGT